MKSPKIKKLPKDDLDAVARLSSMQYFPAGRQGQKALTDAFATACANKDRVKQAVQYFLDEFDKCPTVHEIKAHCYQNYLHMKDGVNRLKQLKETVECSKCDQLGRKYIVQVDGKWIDMLPDMIADGKYPTALTFCDCEIGKELKRITK